MREKISTYLNDQFWLESVYTYAIVALISAILLSISYFLVKRIIKAKRNYALYSIIVSNLIWFIISFFISIIGDKLNIDRSFDKMSIYLLTSIYLINIFIWIFGLIALATLFLRFLIEKSREDIKKT